MKVLLKDTLRFRNEEGGEITITLEKYSKSDFGYDQVPIEHIKEIVNEIVNKDWEFVPHVTTVPETRWLLPEHFWHFTFGICTGAVLQTVVQVFWLGLF